ncbi:hypothetical protein AX767_01195 [Variovorax sp. PAMC 28711]|nr:hypothetical protein AX767_01195 [Variovorax sp. PAMC 28711]
MFWRVRGTRDSRDFMRRAGLCTSAIGFTSTSHSRLQPGFLFMAFSIDRSGRVALRSKAKIAVDDGRVV